MNISEGRKDNEVVMLLKVFYGTLNFLRQTPIMSSQVFLFSLVKFFFFLNWRKFKIIEKES